MPKRRFQASYLSVTASRIIPFFCLAVATRAISTEPEAAYVRLHGPSGSGDYLEVKGVNPTDIRFCLALFSSGGNLCNLAGSAKRPLGATGSVYTYRSDERGSACTLELQRTSTAWVIRDKSRCAQRFCGAGLGIREVRFSLRQKTKVRPCIDEEQ